eukprot:5221015-Prymnesium_polylepis.1
MGYRQNDAHLTKPVQTHLEAFLLRFIGERLSEYELARALPYDFQVGIPGGSPRRMDAGRPRAAPPG